MKMCGVELMALAAAIRQMEASGAPGISVSPYHARHILADLVELSRLRHGLRKERDEWYGTDPEYRSHCDHIPPAGLAKLLEDDRPPAGPDVVPADLLAGLAVTGDRLDHTVFRRQLEQEQPPCDGGIPDCPLCEEHCPATCRWARKASGDEG